MSKYSFFKSCWKEIAIGIVSTVVVSFIVKILKMSSIYIFLLVCIICILILLYIINILVNKNLFAQKINRNVSEKILAECLKADWINIFVMKGDMFTKQDQILHKIFEERYSYIKINFLMSSPSSPALEKRAEEIFHRPAEHLKQETQISLDTALSLSEHNPNLSIRVHNENAVVRLIYTENIMFFSFFVPKQYSLNAPFYKVHSDSPMYIAYDKFFKDIYQTKSTTPEEASWIK